MYSFLISRTSGTSRFPFRVGPSGSVLASRRTLPSVIRDVEGDTIRPVWSVPEIYINIGHTERTSGCVWACGWSPQSSPCTAAPTGHPEPLVGSGNSEPPAVGSEHTSLSSSEIGVASMPISPAAGRVSWLCGGLTGTSVNPSSLLWNFFSDRHYARWVLGGSGGTGQTEESGQVSSFTLTAVGQGAAAETLRVVLHPPTSTTGRATKSLCSLERLLHVPLPPAFRTGRCHGGQGAIPLFPSRALCCMHATGSAVASVDRAGETESPLFRGGPDWDTGTTIGAVTRLPNGPDADHIRVRGGQTEATELNWQRAGSAVTWWKDGWKCGCSVGSCEPSDIADGEQQPELTGSVQEHHFDISGPRKGHTWGVTKPLEAPAFKGVLSEPEVAVQDLFQLVVASGGSSADRDCIAGDLLLAPVLRYSSGCSVGLRAVTGPLLRSAFSCSSGGSPLLALADYSSSGCSVGLRGATGPLPVSAPLCSSGGSPLLAVADDSAPWASPQQGPAERRRAGAGSAASLSILHSVVVDARRLLGAPGSIGHYLKCEVDSMGAVLNLTGQLLDECQTTLLKQCDWFSGSDHSKSQSTMNAA